MPRNNGIYSPPSGTGGTPQTVISSAMFNAWVADITADQNNPRPIIAGGTGSATSQGAIDAFFGAPRTIVDERLLFVDPSDPTKRVRLDAGNITAGQTRVLTMPDENLNLGDLLRGHIHGLTLSNNVADPTNDIDIAPGQCASDAANPVLMSLGAALTKRLDAAWSAGSGNGGLDTGTVTDGTYHVWLIQRSDTGVVDALFSLSATAPAMPAGYDRKAYLWPIMRSGGSIVQFVQIGNAFWKVTPTIDRSSTAAMAPGLLSLSVPTGVRVRPILQSSIDAPAASSVGNGIGSGDAGTTTATAQTAYETVITDVVDQFVTDTSARIYWSTIIYAGSITSNTLATCGWHFDREAQL